MITEEIFQAFLKCETKSFLKLSNDVGERCEVNDWQRQVSKGFLEKCRATLCAGYADGERLSSASLPPSLNDNKGKLVINSKSRVSNEHSGVEPAIKNEVRYVITSRPIIHISPS